MSNIGFWKSEEMSVQVLKSDKNLMTLTVCEPTSQKVYTVLFTKDDDDEKLQNTIFVNWKIMEFKKLKVHSIANLQVNCTEEIGAESAGRNVHVSLISIMVLLLARFLMS
jgi:hypothetical protein